jgi:predicted nucleotidyltransferase component of viral defense system
MFTQNELRQLALDFHIAPFSVFREYCQTLFLSYLSQHPNNNHFIFKGGTAIRLLYQGNRFSEDLDFTVVDLDQNQAVQAIENAVDAMSKEIDVTIRPIKSIAGKSFKLTVITPLHPQPIVIKIDLSFRDFLDDVKSGPILTKYPILFNRLVYYYATRTILAEKIHAIMSRVKGRDLYDIWFLVSMQTKFDKTLIEKKFRDLDKTFNLRQCIYKITSFPLASFVADLDPFVNDLERPHLAETHQIITSTLPERIKAEL